MSLTGRMPFAEGYTPVAPGQLATVVTWLEITEFPPMPLPVPPEGFRIRAVEKPDLMWYRDVFRAVGGPWLWNSRLRMPDEDLAAILHSPATEVFCAERNGEAKALLELHDEGNGEVELAYFGVTPDCIGSGLGRFLMDCALAQVIQRSVRRFWVHTCTLDHPRALAFYMRSGFRAYKQAVEIMADPRLSGVLPEDIAPQIPLIRP